MPDLMICDRPRQNKAAKFFRARATVRIYIIPGIGADNLELIALTAVEIQHDMDRNPVLQNHVIFVSQ